MALAGAPDSAAAAAVLQQGWCGMPQKQGASAAGKCVRVCMWVAECVANVIVSSHRFGNAHYHLALPLLCRYTSLLPPLLDTPPPPLTPAHPPLSTQSLLDSPDQRVAQDLPLLTASLSEVLTQLAAVPFNIIWYTHLTQQVL